MKKSEFGDEAARAYRRVRDKVAEHQVVAAAEDVLTDTWIHELELLRAGLKQAAGRARESGRAAVRRAHDAEQAGDRAELDHARQSLIDVLAFERLELSEVGRLLQAVDAELEAACEVGIDRARRGRDDLARLRFIQRKVYGRNIE